MRALTLVLAALLVPGCRCSDSDEVPRLLGQIEQREWQRLDPRSWLPPLLEDERPAVRQRATLALGRFGLVDRASIALLERRLADPAAGVRRVAALALQLAVTAQPEGAERRRLGSRATRAIANALRTSRDRGGRGALLRALGAVAPAGAGAGRILARAAHEPDLRRAALEALATLGQRDALETTGADAAAVRAGLIHGLGTPDAALAALAAAEAPAIVDDPLLRALLEAGGRESASPTLLRRVTRAVARSRAAEQLDWLVERSRSHDRSIQAEAIRGMVAAGPDGAKRLARRLKRMWRSVSADHYRLTGAPLQPVLLGLELLQPHAARPGVSELAQELLELADATDAAVSYGEKEAHAVDLVHCGAARLVDLAAGELRSTPGCGSARSPRVTAAMREGFVLDVALRLGKEQALERLSRDLQAREAGVRLAAARGLARLPGKAPVGLLRPALTDPDPRVAAAAARSVARLGTGGAELVPALGRRLGNLDARRWPGEACELARALTGLAPRPRASALLRPLLDVPVSGVRRCVRVALPGLGGPGERWPTGVTRERRPQLPRRAKVVTTRGVFFLRLMVDEAPGAVSRLLEQGRYRGARVRVGASSGRVELELERGAKPPLPLPSELTGQPFDAGAVGILEPAGRDSGGGDLFVLLEREPWRDGRFTLVGRVEPPGMKVLWRLQPGDQVSGIYAAPRRR